MLNCKTPVAQDKVLSAVKRQAKEFSMLYKLIQWQLMAGEKDSIY
jgi:hypothetical protein